MKSSVLLYLSVQRTYAPVAQLDRVTDYESVGRGFESLLAYQKRGHPFRMASFLVHQLGLERAAAAQLP